MSEYEIANEYLDFACVSNFFHIYDTENDPPLTLIFCISLQQNLTRKEVSQGPILSCKHS